MPYLGQYPNLVILRAFTKLYAMAGVRLGYCVCSDAKRKEQLMESGQPWGVSLLAQEAGVAALSEQAYADRVRKLVEQQRPILVKGLRQAGFTVWEGKANYLLFRSHDATLGKRMEEAGLIASGTSPDGNLVEIVELKDHPFFIASQFHPEFKSRPTRPHPLFDSFIKTSIDNK